MDDIILFVRVETQNLIKKRRLLRHISNQEELMENIINQITEGANDI